DAMPEAQRLPVLACLLERVERVFVGEIADRVHGDGPARLGSTAEDVGELLGARDLDARSVGHQRRLRTERAVHEDLEIAEAQASAAEAGGKPSGPHPV